MPSDAREEPLPRVVRPRSLLFALPAAGRRWSAGLRAAVAVALPGTLVLLSGHAGAALFVTFGSFAVLYGEGRPYRVRARVVLTAGAALLLSAGLGTAVGTLGAGKPAVVLVVTVVAVLAVYTVDALRLGPPGALFFALACGGALVATEAGADPLSLLACTALGAVSSAVVSMAGVVADRDKPERVAVQRAVRAVDTFLGHAGTETRHAASSALSAAWNAVHDAGRKPGSEPATTLIAAHRRFVAAAGDASPGDALPLPRPGVGYRLRRSASLRSHAMVTALRVGVTCVAAGSLSASLGLTRPHWAVLSALVVLQQGTDRVRANVRGLQRFAGTAVGLGLFAALSAFSPAGFALVAAVAALQFCIELFVPRNYAVAVVFITPVALLAGGAAATGAIGPVIRDRLAETAVGVALAFLSLYLLAPHAHRRTFHWTEARVRAAARQVLVSAPAMAPRRDLQFELEGTTRAAVDSAHNDLAWTRRHWPAHAELVHLGYDLLAACWATAPGDRLAGAQRWEQAFRALSPAETQQN
ncbi:FUSC family protein [Amycolatopsis australiensis]|uniref:Fusaric acid resistance protein-like n=1 Tax=Amycolatopsis australiensis TaxID=546364 RepID=A0A1K1SNY4_9PSEU|nr:FUSC family protein [Amycolatopsis australiensis]SFW85990.1 Fusaric acid resistance protein-like [Amycolatopsis australiensis]